MSAALEIVIQHRELITATKQQLLKDFLAVGIRLELNNEVDRKAETIVAQIVSAISSPSLTASTLQQLIYRVDLSEKQVQKCANKEALAYAILEREALKVYIKQQYKAHLEG
ncbi:MAG: hypothetical protein RIQ89_1326 [Bacteroidota bacterium]